MILMDDGDLKSARERSLFPLEQFIRRGVGQLTPGTASFVRDDL